MNYGESGDIQVAIQRTSGETDGERSEHRSWASIVHHQALREETIRSITESKKPVARQNSGTQGGDKRTSKQQ